MRRVLNIALALAAFDGFYHAVVRAPLREHLKVTDRKLAIHVSGRTVYVCDREPTASDDPFLS